MFVLDVTKVRIKLTQRELVTSGSVGIYDVKFNFDSVWNGLVKTAVFRAGEGKIYEALLDSDNPVCQIPWELFCECSPGKPLFIGCYGVNEGTIVIPTIWCNVGYIEEGVKGGESSMDPSPGIYEQIVSSLEKLKDHNNIGHRDDPDQHPIEAISGFDEVSNSDIFNLWKGGGLGG